MTVAAMIGDSQTGGLAGPLKRLLLPVDWDVRWDWHIAGAGTRGIINELLPGALAARPAVLIVNAGGNDVYLPVSTARQAWGDLAEAARRERVRVVWIGPPAAVGNPELDARRRALSEAQSAYFATKPNVTWISGRATASGLPRQPDGVHLTPAGYQTWANRLVGPVTGSSGWGIGGTLLLAGALLGGAYIGVNMATGPRRRRRGRW